MNLFKSFNFGNTIMIFHVFVFRKCAVTESIVFLHIFF